MKKLVMVSVFVFGLMNPGLSEKQAVPAAMTHADMIAALAEVDPSVSRTIGAQPFTFPKAENRPATRAEIIALLDQMIENYKPAFRATPRGIRVEKRIIDEYNADSQTREQLARLVGWGFVGPVAPLVTNKSGTLTNEEFGDALGLALAQVMFLGHQPDPRWTPSLSTGE